MQKIRLQQKKEQPLLDKIIAQGGGPVLGLFSPKDTATVNAYFKRADIRILLQVSAKVCLGKPTTSKMQKNKDIDAGRNC
jgi:SecD/SecF fusion protein